MHSHFENGCSAYANYQYADAAVAFRRCLEEDPNNAGLHYRLALSLTRTGEHEAALQHCLIGLPELVLQAVTNQSKVFGAGIVLDLCDAAEQSGLPSEEIAYCRGLAHCLKHVIIPFDKEEAQAAISELQQLQNHPMAAVFRGLMIADLFDWKEAVVEFNRATELNPSLDIAHSFKVHYNALLGKHSAAIKDASKIPANSPDSMLDRRAEEHLNKRDYPKAVDDATEAIRSDIGSKRRLYFIRGAAQYRLGHVADAAADFQETIRRTIKDNGNLANMHTIWSRNEAIETFNRIVSFNGRDDTAYFNRAMAYYFHGCPTHDYKDWSQAKKDIETALSLRPHCALYYLGRAMIVEFYEKEKAVEDCDEAIRLDPNLVEAYTLRAQSSAFSEIDEETTQKHFAEALRLAPGDEMLMQLFRFYLLKRGSQSDQLDAITKQIELTNSPNRYHLFAHRGSIKLNLDDINGAIEDFNLALMFNPEDTSCLEQRRDSLLKRFSKSRNAEDEVLAKRDDAELSRVKQSLPESQ